MQNILVSMMNGFASTNSSITNLNGLYQQQLLQLQALQQPQPMPQPQNGAKDTRMDTQSGSSTPKREKAKSRKRDVKISRFKSTTNLVN